MRFATLESNGAHVLVVVSEDGRNCCPVDRLVPGFAGDLVDLIAAMPDGVSHLPAVDSWEPLTGRVLAPIPVPRKNIYCVGKNYHAHALEFARSGFDASGKKGEDVPSAPILFTKPYTTIVGDGDDVLAFADVTEQLDYEAELGVIIGQGGRGITRADALKHVWGYTIVNDVTARDLQQKHGQWFIGKALDTSCPMGPWITTADGIDGANLQVRCWINDELRQDANTSDLIFDVPTIIETLSAGMTLHPGDIISTGTPAGVGIGFKPPKFLVAGDVMRITIDGLGTLTNRVR